MKNKICLWSAVLLMVLVAACREESDTVYNYAFDTGLNFMEADTSYVGKFKVLWKALDQNYGIWDYERELGLDWDAVYDEYLPKYEALDGRDDVTDAELQALLAETVAPLHDGHFAAQMKNHQTGNFVITSPSFMRKMQREDFPQAYNLRVDLNAYRANGDIVEYKEANTSLIAQLSKAFKTDGMNYRWAKAEVARLEQLDSRNELEQFQLDGLQAFVSEFEQMVSKFNSGQIDISAAIQLYNQMVSTYQYLQIPGLNVINTAFNEMGINVKYALFSNNIAYFYLSDFYLSPYLKDEYIQQVFANADDATKALVNEVRDTWQSWFNAVQTLHANGQLRGVIIDVRNNSGGMLEDYQYVLGSLLPSGGVDIGLGRFKRGLGRYDYSPLTSACFKTMEEPHETITEPVVVLCNCNSVSMSELTSLGCKTLANGTLIGKPTHGGVCELHGNPKSYYLNYAGIIGERDKTAVWLYIPTMVTMSKEKQIFEGVGIMPDIEVDYDPALFSAQGRDSQLERAMQFLNTGN